MIQSQDDPQRDRVDPDQSNKTPTKTGVLFIRRVPEDVKNQFKGWCGSHGISMTDAIIFLLNEASKPGSRLVTEDMIKAIREIKQEDEI